jgi:single-strand DNA-binding protein
MNTVTLIGTLTRDPQMRKKGQTKVCAMRLAESNGNKESPLFINVAAFGRQAETCKKYLAKGRHVAVCGQLRFRAPNTRLPPTASTSSPAACAAARRRRARRRSSPTGSARPGVTVRRACRPRSNGQGILVVRSSNQASPELPGCYALLSMDGTAGALRRLSGAGQGPRAER